MAKLLLADDHDLVRATIAEYLGRSGGHEVLQASSYDAAAEIARETPDLTLVLLDYAMPGMNGLGGLRDMVGQVACPVAILSGAATPDIARQSFKAGAAGFLPKTLSPQELIEAVTQILGGEIFLPVEFMSQDQTDMSDANLTPRERDVLQGVAEGKSNKEIARDLGIQEVTVKLHVKTLSRKLGARNRTHAAMLGRDLGMT